MNKYYYLDGTFEKAKFPDETKVLHRINGPAVILDTNQKYYYQFGRLHRKDGPAIEYLGKLHIYFWQGVRVTKEEHKRLKYS